MATLLTDAAEWQGLSAVSVDVEGSLPAAQNSG